MKTYTFSSLLAIAIAVQPLCTTAQTLSRSFAARTTADSMLLISQVNAYYRASSYVPYDSTTFSYSNGRGTNKHDISDLYSYDTTSAAYTLSTRVFNTYDPANMITSMLAQGWKPALSDWANGYRRFYTYDGMNNLLTTLTQTFDAVTTTWEDFWTATNTYTTTNKLASITARSLSTVTESLENEKRVTYTYDASDNLITELRELWNSGAWTNSGRCNYSYDGYNNLVISLYEGWEPTSTPWVPQYRDSSAYDATNNRITRQLWLWDLTTNAWRKAQFETYSGFVDHQPQLVIGQYWDAIALANVNTAKIIYSYNSAGQIEFSQKQTWNTATNAWEPKRGDEEHRYHYAYVTSVAHVTAQATGDMSVFPVPAKDALTISLEWKEPQPFTISIIDMMGRVCGAWSVSSRSKHTETIPLHYLAAGNYVIKAVGANAAASRTVTVEK